ncbi:MAG: DNA gyrase inhibitor YacG [Mariniblastus sp.]|nr:DNA gyrase inhibitor YacG [Mariniblastus sp.]
MSRTCSMCEKPFDPATSRCLPFCSVRCQQLDLGKWMSESYGLPLDGQEDLDHESFEE